MSDSPVSPLAAFSTILSDIVAAASQSVVGIRSHRSLSSGFIWRPGLVVTADEALAEEGEVTVTLPNGDKVPATVAGRDPTTDIALLRIEHGTLQPVAFVTETPRAGALALAVGAGGGAALAAFGIVARSGPSWRSMRGGEIDARIELDLRLRRQAEGSLVLDAGGRALGMAVLGPRRRVLVIPGATIERVAAKLATQGRIPRGYLGLALQAVRAEGDGTAGVMIMSVDKNGPGAAAGIRQGDVIVTWNGQSVRGLGALLRALGPDSVGRAVTINLRRGGEPLELPLAIGERAPRLSEGAEDTLVLALRLDDPLLAERVASLLAGVPGLRLAGAGEPADITLIAVASPEPDAEAPLTPRELEVLTLLAEGASNKAIARRLGISVHTAKFHVGQLLDKLDATGRTDAVAHAARLGVIHL